VEFAIILPLLMLTLMGIIQFGLMLSAYVGATNVAREAARYGSVCVVRDAATASSCGADTLAYLNTILPNRINAATVVPAQTTVTYCHYVAPKSDPADPDKFNFRLTVDLAIRYPLFIPVIASILDGLDGEPGDGQFRLRASEAMRVEGTGLAVPPASPALCA
jgi:Flp pilus assembly protein TadG